MDGPTRIKKLILDGEGLTLDFKKTISNYEKIARTLSAFGNTSGGKLLVGVEDNGAVVGVSCEEDEQVMLAVDGNDYCKRPHVPRVDEVYVDNRMALPAEIDECNIK